ncbi:AAEL005982-PA [Aedes aegypti]|uniref:AAEL005982-PA n=1 Tax=Aedes aegypti TaxID=7159 RepID=Q177Y8_AEDAE|nr:AAEL005982-PA [Aedes aegypti]
MSFPKVIYSKSNKIAFHSVPTELTDEGNPQQPHQKKRKPGKLQNIQEETTIDNGLASQLDLSCMAQGLIHAPEIDNGYVVKYNRRRKDDHIFLVAFYECDDYYELQPPDTDRLFCSGKQWIGQTPSCVSTRGEGEEDEEEEDEEEEEDYDEEDEGGPDPEQQPSEPESGKDRQQIPEIIPLPPTTTAATTIATETTEHSTDEHLHHVESTSTPPSRHEQNSEGSVEITTEQIHHPESQPTAEDDNDIEENVIDGEEDGEESDPITEGPTATPVKIATCGVDRGGCDHECHDGHESHPEIRCSCYHGFLLDERDGRTCHDIDECEDPSIAELCPHGCENLHGSYRCRQPEPISTEASPTEDELEEDGDEDEEAEEDTELGYELADDDRSCQDINECEAYGQQEEDDYEDEAGHGVGICSHECVNAVGSFECRCPDNFHLNHDRRTCVRDFCADLYENPNKTRCSHECKDGTEGFVCSCPEFYILDEYDQKTCRNVYSCGEEYKKRCNPGVCRMIAGGDYRCECPLGYQQHDHSCHDIDECELGRHLCSHNCHNTAGDYQCSCPKGFKLDSDQRTCHDINECHEDNGGCEQNCLNFEGGHKCSCYEGFEPSPDDNRSCVDIDECSMSQGGCDHACHNSEGSFHCSCHSGYRLSENGHSCLDINECEKSNGHCSHICINLLGSHQCSCPKGLYLMEDGKTCDFVDECELNNGGCSHGCHYEHGVVSCTCPKGFELERNNFKTCIDVNECEHRNGGCSDTCTNLPGSYHCSCPVGFELGRNRHTCEDIDECIENNGNCSNICINLLGDYKCACEAGFELEDDQQTCRDVDECSTKIHDCSHICVNVPGTFECECPPGFILGRDKFTCEDVNECETLPNKADCEHHCINLPGSYRCGCEDGHRLELDNRTCSDIDECSDELRRCSHDCFNTKGGFECSCPSGLRLDVDKVTCLDIDECKINNFNGGCSHICENQHGSFKCLCPEGMTLGDDQATCEDDDECSILNGGCSQRCVNFLGGYRCECESGFALMNDNKTCEVSNPCALRNGGCQHFCNLHNGVPSCSCREGFMVSKSNPASCVDIDECQTPSDNNCQQNHRCVCPPGHKMGKDRKTCLEIKDRCKPLTPPKNGDVRCSRSRHKTEIYYRTKCSITCNKGFKLLGPGTKHCNGTGQWDAEESLCVPQSCPRLHRPEHGTILPVACMSGKIFAGERCVLHCKAGFKPIGKRTTVCDTEQKWTPTPNLRCVPITTPTPAPIKPHIQCPPDVHEVLPVGHYTMKIRLEQPKSNVDWHQFVDAHPAWGKHLEAELPAGETGVTFRARSPNSPMNDVCRVLITIRERRPPQVVNCPESFNVQLENHETSRSVYWVEPNFETDSEIKQLYKSHTPGQVLIAGVHYVNYVATDSDGLSAKCSFGITVKASLEPYGHRRPAHGRPLETNRLDNHESYLICPGKSPILVDPNSPIVVPPVLHRPPFVVGRGRYPSLGSTSTMIHIWDCSDEDQEEEDDYDTDELDRINETDDGEDENEEDDDESNHITRSDHVEFLIDVYHWLAHRRRYHRPRPYN